MPSAPLFGFVHIAAPPQHQRGDRRRPGRLATDGPFWQLPFRWLTIDIWYATFYVKNIRRRSGRELAETRRDHRGVRRRHHRWPRSPARSGPSR